MNALYFFILLLALQVADVASTAYAIRRDIGHEANPVMAWLIDQLGLVFGLLLPKVAMLLMLYLFAILYREFAPFVLGALSALYAWVVFRNLRVIWMAQIDQ